MQNFWFVIFVFLIKIPNALSQMKVEMDGAEMGKFVDETVTQ